MRGKLLQQLTQGSRRPWLTLGFEWQNLQLSPGSSCDIPKIIFCFYWKLSKSTKPQSRLFADETQPSEITSRSETAQKIRNTERTKFDRVKSWKKYFVLASIIECFVIVFQNAASTVSAGFDHLSWHRVTGMRLLKVILYRNNYVVEFLCDYLM